MTGNLTGGCYCGAVRYDCAAEPVVMGHCQCTQCQKFSSTGHSSHIGVPKAAVTLTGATKHYDAKADSGNTVSRHFCPTCGCQVYSTNSGFPDMLFLRAPSLDDPSLFQPQLLVFTASAQRWDLIDPALPSFEGMPPPEAMPITDG